MKKTLAALSAAAVIAAGTMTMPTQADAHAWWVAPAISGGAILGTAAIASAANANAYHGRPYAYAGPAGYAYAGPGSVYVEPSCRIVRERTPYGIRRVRVC